MILCSIGQMPSAPYSTLDQEYSVWTQPKKVTSHQNILWARQEICPDAHFDQCFGTAINRFCWDGSRSEVLDGVMEAH